MGQDDGQRLINDGMPPAVPATSGAGNSWVGIDDVDFRRSRKELEMGLLEELDSRVKAVEKKLNEAVVCDCGDMAETVVVNCKFTGCELPKPKTAGELTVEKEVVVGSDYVDVFGCHVIHAYGSSVSSISQLIRNAIAKTIDTEIAKALNAEREAIAAAVQPPFSRSDYQPAYRDAAYDECSKFADWVRSRK
jgi:hypothetical protein